MARPALELLQLYDEALPHVYGYLPARCGDIGLAEDLMPESSWPPSRGPVSRARPIRRFRG